MDRRTFLSKLGLGLAATGAALGGCGAACTREEGRARAAGTRPVVPAGPPRVASMIDGGIRKAQRLDEKRVAALLERAVRGALDAPDAAAALAGLLGDDAVVGVKLNNLAGPPLAPTPAFVKALVALLGKAGVTPGRIIFFERGERDITKGGFEVKRSGGGPLFVGHDTPGFGYQSEISTSGSVGSCLSRVVTDRITALINLGVLKDHNLAGLSAGMKNLFGIIHNPNRYHDDLCDPVVADVSAFPVVRRKLRLVLVDALTEQYEGGPGYLPAFAWERNGVMAATDPVALDRVGWDIVEAQRKKKGLPSLTEAGRPPRWIRTAARRGLGTDDPDKFELVEDV